MRKGILPPRAWLSGLLLLGACGCGARSTPTGIETGAPNAAAPNGAAASAAEAPLSPTRLPVRAAYFYGYMPPAHLDSLASVGINRAVVKWIGDSLGTREKAELARLHDAATRLGVELVPAWTLQTRSRMTASTRRYTWGEGTVEADVACPLDSIYWGRALSDRALEFLTAQPRITKLVLDLELYHGSRHHYDAGPCHCGACLLEYRASRGLGARGDETLEQFQEERLTRILTASLRRVSARRPGWELGVFDLDHGSFVHRAMGRALMRAGVPATDYAEMSYWMGASILAIARDALRARGVNAPIIGGLWLARITPSRLPFAIRSMEGVAQGFFLFTTFSLWVDPAERTGAYALKGASSDYWSAISRAVVGTGTAANRSSGMPQAVR